MKRKSRQTCPDEPPPLANAVRDESALDGIVTRLANRFLLPEREDPSSQAPTHGSSDSVRLLGFGFEQFSAALLPSLCAGQEARSCVTRLCAERRLPCWVRPRSRRFG